MTERERKKERERERERERESFHMIHDFLILHLKFIVSNKISVFEAK